MTNTTIAKLAVAIGLIGSLAFSAATPSLAAATANAGTHYYEPGDNGSVWSYYPGYTDERTAQRPADRTTALDARAQAPAFRHRGPAVDDPPGSAYQTQGNNDAIGCPC